MRKFVLVALVVLIPALAYPQGDKKPRAKIADEAGLFSKEAIERTQAILNEIGERHQKDLVIETYENAPDKDLAAWAKEHVKKQNLDGVYVVITNTPKRFQVQVGDKTLASGLFTKDNLQELLKTLPGLAKDRDATLEAIAKVTLEAMNRNVKGLPEWPRLVGFWLGPDIATKKGDKGQVRVQFLETDSKPVAKIGYLAGAVKELTGTFAVQFNAGKRELVLKDADAGKDLVLSFVLQGETLKIMAPNPIALTGVEGHANLTGTWRRVVKK